MPSNSQSPLEHAESLSAVMDGSSHELELHRLLSACADDVELRKRWARYQLAAAVLQKQPVALNNSLAFADAVRRAIDVEDGRTALTTETQAAGRGSVKMMVRVAVAASVALLVIVGAQWQQQTGSDAVRQVADVAPVAQHIEHSVAVSTQKPLAGALGVDNIFSQSGDAPNMRLGNPQEFENAALKTGRTQVPLINTAEQSFSRK
jgi:negative regulator of sigma E activity